MVRHSVAGEARKSSSPRASRPLTLVLGAIAVAAASFGFAAVARPSAAEPSAVDAPISVDPPADAPGLDAQPLADVDEAIAAWSSNLRAEPADFIAAMNLAELYLARARISGDAADIGRAAQSVGRAVTIDPSLLAARLLRAQTAHAAHQFVAAEADALLVLEAAPDAPEALAVLGDARLELGAYDDAAVTYARLAEVAEGPAVDARLARLAAATGRLDEARELAAIAARDATAEGTPSATLAWYHGLKASLAFQAGDLPAASVGWNAAIALWDGSAAAHAGLGRTLAAIGDLPAARSSLERAVAIQPQPESLRLLSEVQELLGDSEAAEATRVTFLAVAELGGHARQLALYLADRGEDPARAIQLARADLRVRQDAYAHDALAWALLAAGRADEAEVEIRAARSSGTEDAMLDFHAGMIALALGREAEAGRLLTAALERNEGFDSIQARVAELTLGRLDGTPRP